WKPREGAGVYADLNGDGAEEFSLLFPEGSHVYRRSERGWQMVGSLKNETSPYEGRPVVEDVLAGRVTVEPPRWNDLQIGHLRFQVQTMEKERKATGSDDVLITEGFP
ncbi:MAG: hypothetical protein ABI661_11940, partial [Gammaproteobacteria bacterium]